MCISGDKNGIATLGKMTLREMYRRKFDYRDKTVNDKKVLKKTINQKRRCVCMGGKCTS